MKLLINTDQYYCLKLKLFSREVTNGVEKKGKKKSVGRPPGPYTRKMIQRMSEPSILVSSIQVYLFNKISTTLLFPSLIK